MKFPNCVLLFLCLGLASNVSSAELRAGAAAVRITPDEPMPLAGYYSVRLSQGVHDDLFAKTIVLESGTNRAALVVCDLITMPRSAVVAARRLISEQTGIPGEFVMVSATHTHTGPVLDTGSARVATDDSFSSVRNYTKRLPELIAQSVKEAAGRLEAARFTVATVQENHLSHNRRYFMQDGTVGWNPGKLNPKIVKAAGPIDPDVTLLHLQSLSNNAIAGYVNFAMHPDTAGGLLISADYPFTLSRLLSEYKGSNYLTVFANGACGNINHVDAHWADPQKGPAESSRLGTILAGNVLQAFTRLKPVDGAELRARSAIFNLDLPELKPGDLEKASNIVAQINSKPAPKFLDQVFAFKALDVAARKGEPQQVEVQVIALGNDIAWVALPGEIFVELGLEIKRKSPFKNTVIAELANGAIGYIPDEVAYEQGNYEPVSARCAKGSGERLVKAALKVLAELKPTP